MACHKCAGVGTVELRCETPEGEQVNLLREVAYVPGVAENLFSVKKATAVGAEVVFRGKVCEVSTDVEVVLRAEENAESMSVVCQPKPTWEDTCLLVREAESPVLWHRRLGHAGYKSLAKMVEGNSVRGGGVKAEAFRNRKTSVCEPCIIGKHTGREPLPKESDSKDSKNSYRSCKWTCAGPCR
ncbi:putative retrotransposon protein with integrase and Ribonuclease H-like domains [Klebsormidium nitens]|uniref:Putative retrotransposon protein with integrase and Ribonuclease H-like domains n=1 Tax=Klebsormidium nitens TaxID=105231 RepID=A0A1Y1IP72_KLENI|nr:putative retrotransposon protein with integrase and Ribonuclease H-like domains [Klebsormidium nitens]|eukprot:GAQ92534.1 putative retrotransposon protein with integrase and Ribonuclease H-like domains [Klebsormidium nitens]